MYLTPLCKLSQGKMFTEVDEKVMSCFESVHEERYLLRELRKPSIATAPQTSIGTCSAMRGLANGDWLLN